MCPAERVCASTVTMLQVYPLLGGSQRTRSKLCLSPARSRGLDNRFADACAAAHRPGPGCTRPRQHTRARRRVCDGGDTEHAHPMKNRWPHSMVPTAADLNTLTVPRSRRSLRDSRAPLPIPRCPVHDHTEDRNPRSRFGRLRGHEEQILLAPGAALHLVVATDEEGVHGRHLVEAVVHRRGDQRHRLEP